MKYSEKEISLLVKDKGLTAEFGEGIIYIKTNVSRWRILHNYEMVTQVWHENKVAIPDSLSKNKINSGFHKQKIYMKTYEAVFDYIVRHDNVT